MQLSDKYLQQVDPAKISDDSKYFISSAAVIQLDVQRKNFTGLDE